MDLEVRYVHYVSDNVFIPPNNGNILVFRWAYRVALRCDVTRSLNQLCLIVIIVISPKRLRIRKMLRLVHAWIGLLCGTKQIGLLSRKRSNVCL